MDPLSALSLAVNIIDLLDLAVKVVSVGYEISKNASGRTNENQEVVDVAGDIRLLLDGVNKSQGAWLARHAGTELEANEKALQEICTGCNEVAQELVIKLEKLRPYGTFRGIAVIRSSLLIVWKKDEIESYKARLQFYREALNTRFLAGLREHLRSLDQNHDIRFTTLDESCRRLAVSIIDQREIFAAKLDFHTNVLEDIRSRQDKTNSLLINLATDRSRSQGSAYQGLESDHAGGIPYPLHQASKEGSIRALRKLLGTPLVDVNAVDQDGRTALHYCGSANIAEKLLDHHAMVDADDFDGLTPLHVATRERRLDVVKILLARGANTKAKDESGKCAFDYAENCPAAAFMLKNGVAIEARDAEYGGNSGLFHMAWLGDMEGLLFYLGQGALVDARNNHDQTCLAEAGRFGDLEILKVLLDHGADVNAKQGGNFTPLLIAVGANRLSIARELIARAADIEARNGAGHNALTEAASKGHWHLVRLLINHGARLDCRDSSGNTILLLSIHHGDIDDVNFLLAKGAPLDIPNKYGDTPLWSAVKFQKPKELEILLKAGANAALYCEGHTPLTLACTNGYTDLVKILLAHGANPSRAPDISKPEPHNCHPLRFACLYNHVEVVRSLLESGADPELRDGDRWTALHNSVRESVSSPEIVKLLLVQGADFEARDPWGASVLAMACRFGNPDVAKVLLDAGADIESTCRDRESSDQQENGFTPLLHAVLNVVPSPWSPHTRPFPATVTLLCNRGANLEATTTPRGRTALLLSLQFKRDDLTDALLAAGVDVNHADANKWTPLMQAAQDGNVRQVKQLLDRGADASLRDRRSVTAWIVAKHSNTDGLLRDFLGP